MSKLRDFLPEIMGALIALAVLNVWYLSSLAIAKSVVPKSWGGYCWIEVNGYLGDLSIFITTYAMSGRSALKDYMLDRFGPGWGALLSPVEDLPEGMQYVPQYVLKDSQVDMFTASLGYQLENDI